MRLRVTNSVFLFVVKAKQNPSITNTIINVSIYSRTFIVRVFMIYSLYVFDHHFIIVYIKWPHSVASIITFIPLYILIHSKCNLRKRYIRQYTTLKKVCLISCLYNLTSQIHKNATVAATIRMFDVRWVLLMSYLPYSKYSLRDNSSTCLHSCWSNP